MKTAKLPAGRSVRCFPTTAIRSGDSGSPLMLYDLDRLALDSHPKFGAYRADNRVLAITAIREQLTQLSAGERDKPAP